MSSTPDGWHRGRLEDFIYLQRGFDITESQAIKGDIPVISSSGFSYFHSAAKVDAPGVVIGRKGKLGKVHFVDVPFWPHDTTLWVKDFKGNSPAFAAIFLEYLRLERLDAATSVPTLNRNNVHALEVVFPPLSEQRKIAQILGTWDAAIGRVEQLIAALQRRKQGLMQRLLAGQVRFAEFARSEAKQSTRYGSLPADWAYVPISDIAHEVSLRNGSSSQLPVLSCTKYDGLVDSLIYFGRQIFSKDTSDYKVVKRGQFAYATNHIEEGSIGYQDKYDAGLISPMYTVFATTGPVNDSYLYRLLKTEQYRHIFEVNTSGTVNRRGRLGWEDFARIRVPLPSLEEQAKLAEFFAAVDKEIELQGQHLEQLRRQKQGLMQRLLTGEVRVNAAGMAAGVNAGV